MANREDYKIQKLVDYYRNSSDYVSDFYIPSWFNSIANNYRFNEYHNYYCYGNKDSINLVMANSYGGTFTELNVIYLYRDYTYEIDNIKVNSASVDNQSLISSYIVNNCYATYYYIDSFKETNNIHFNINNNDDFINSQQPSQYIFTMLYVFIPILLFIFALKVFKNGLFRK